MAAPNEWPTWTVLEYRFETPGSLPPWTISVRALSAATSRKIWMSLTGSPWDEAPMPRRSHERVEYFASRALLM